MGKVQRRLLQQETLLKGWIWHFILPISEIPQKYTYKLAFSLQDREFPYTVPFVCTDVDSSIVMWIAQKR